MLQIAEMFINFIAGIWTVVFNDTILNIGNIDVSLGILLLPV